VDIVVVGELNVDLVLIGLPSLPTYREIRLAKDMRFALGGASGLFACNVARLGTKVGFVGKVGADEFGDFLLRCLQQCGVDTSHVIRDSSGRTGICVCLSFPDEYAMASYPGIRETFCVDDIDFDYVKTARHLHMSSFYLQPALQAGCPKLFLWAKDAGMSTSLDPDHDPHGRWDNGMRDLLPHLDVFLPNEHEAKCIASVDDVVCAAEKLRTMARTVVIKRGDKGALAATPDRTLSVPAFAVRPVDTTGAGDSFNAGFLFQYLRGSSLEKCLKWGNACGALSTQAVGGLAAFPAPQEVEKFLLDRIGAI
jgi:sugar/nucleoside kinase (ribokinase family)